MTEKPATPWSGRFLSVPGDAQQAFGASIGVDKRLYAEDIAASLAHAHMLAAQGIIAQEDAEQIERGLLAIKSDIEGGSFLFDPVDEDIHMAIEVELIRRVGDAGKRLHTARSRNDQVVTDVRLYAKRQAVDLACRLLCIRRSLLRRAEVAFGAVMPGYTHLQKAQPVLFSHHLLAYTWMFTRDFARVRHAYEAADVMPLGSAALAGTTYPIDRAAVAREIGFASTSENSMDSVSDRDFLLDLTYACALVQVHLSRLAEEIVLWSSDEFGFITLSDEFATGSSIMPQKKNPDFAELVRGKTGRVIGDMIALLVVLKGLPLAYNKDLQEDKEAAFDAIDTVAGSLRVMSGMLDTMEVHADVMRAGALQGFTAATDVADHLVGAGVPFREAHDIVGRLVRETESQGRTLQDLTLEEYQAFSPAFGPGVSDAVDLDGLVRRRVSTGGTGHEAVTAQIEQQRSAIAADESWVRSAEG